MKQRLDIENWDRKEQYLFFKNFDEPFHGVCVNIDCTQAYRKAKELNTSFFLYYLHKSTWAANRVEPFRYRIEDNDVYVYDTIVLSATIDRPNGTFGFSYMDFFEDYALFEAEASKEVDRVRSSTTLELRALAEVIHYSAVPWINFTSLSHARSFSRGDSCPKISFGKVTEVSGKLIMPVSIHVHHALVDGVHIGQYIDNFQQLMND